MENRAGIIKSEIKMESGDTSDKEKELAEVEKRAQAASESQMNTLRDMGETLKKAEDSETKEEESFGHEGGQGRKRSFNCLYACGYPVIVFLLCPFFRKTDRLCFAGMV